MKISANRRELLILLIVFMSRAVSSVALDVMCCIPTTTTHSMSSTITSGIDVLPRCQSIVGRKTVG